MKKRIWSLLLALALTCSLLPGAALAEEMTPEDYLNFEMTDSSTGWKVTGFSAGIPDSQYPADIVIPALYNNEPVTEIAMDAFAGANLHSVQISGQVKLVGANAFKGCQGLASVVFEDYVENGTVMPNQTKIDASAFEDCQNLTSVLLSDSTYEIGAKAFYGCGLLSEIVIPYNVRTIGTDAFSAATASRAGLRHVVFLRPNTVVSVTTGTDAAATTTNAFVWDKLLTVHCVSDSPLHDDLTAIASLDGKIHAFKSLDNSDKNAYAQTVQPARSVCQTGGKVTAAFTCPGTTKETTTTTTVNGKTETVTKTETVPCKHFSGGSKFSMERAISPMPHNIESMPGKEPTCTDSGSSGGTQCTICRKIIDEPTVLDPRHTFGEFRDSYTGNIFAEKDFKDQYNADEEFRSHFSEVELTPADCQTAGRNGYRRLCVNCGALEACEICEAYDKNTYPVDITKFEAYNHRILDDYLRTAGYATWMDPTVSGLKDPRRMGEEDFKALYLWHFSAESASAGGGYLPPYYSGYYYGGTHFSAPTDPDDSRHEPTAEKPVMMYCYNKDGKNDPNLYSTGYDCTTAVYKAEVYTCSRCAKAYFADPEAIETLEPAERHVPDLETVKEERRTEPDCLTAGTVIYEAFDCAVCGTHVTEEAARTVSLPALGHDWKSLTDPVVTKPATCTGAGEQITGVRVCQRENCPSKGTDGKPYQDSDSGTKAVIPALGHERKETVKDEEASKAPTCTEKGVEVTKATVCTRCGTEIPEERKELPAAGHTQGDDLVEKVIKEATCTEDGLMWMGFTCTVCEEQVEGRETVIPAGHSYGEWTVTKEATATEDGSRERVCSVCQNKETEVIPATGSSKPEDPEDPDDERDYDIDLIRTSNGSLTVPTHAAAGETVVIRVYPHSGYELDWIEVTRWNGREIRLYSSSDTRYTFTMPSADVEVRAYFTRISDRSYSSGSSSTWRPGSSSTSTSVTPPQTVIQPPPRASGYAAGFTDVPASHWAAGEIGWASQNGYMGGVGGGQFNPGGSISFQQLWMVLARFMGAYPADMEAARSWAVENGFAEGTNPTTPVTRQQLVLALYRTARLSSSLNGNSASLTKYEDSRLVSASARNAMSWAVANGIISGNANACLNPNGTVTRDQFAVILFRFTQRR